MYEEFRDIAEFRIVYIREAHAANSLWPAPYALKKGIRQPRTYGQRCSTAKMMMEEMKITIPCVIDDMENTAKRAYAAWPDRLFVVDRDGRIAVAARKGPWGFKPALKRARAWLEELRRSHEVAP